MKFLIVLALTCFSLTASAVCELCLSVDKEIAAWDKADSKDTQQEASKESHALLQRLALGIHGGDKNLIPPTVRLLGAIYAKDFDPLMQELENFSLDFKNPGFNQIFRAEMDKLPPMQREKILFGLEVIKGGHEPDNENVE